MGFAMKSELHDFIAETNRRLSERNVAHAGNSQRDEYLDTAVIGGVELYDLANGTLSDHDVDPRVIEAFHRQFPNMGDSLSAFVRQHANNSDALRGVVSGIKGKLFELDYLEYLNHGHLPAGCTAELAEAANQPGWDIVVHNAQGHVIDHLQAKASPTSATHWRTIHTSMLSPRMRSSSRSTIPA